MQGIYRVAAGPVACLVVLSTTELASSPLGLEQTALTSIVEFI
jgi:hypothetical protein